MENKLLLVSLFGFISGVLFHSFFDFGMAFSVFAVVLALAVYLAGIVETTPASAPRRGGRYLSVGIFLLVAGLGMFRYDLSELHKNNPTLDRLLNQKVTLFGVVSDEPDERENSVRLTILADSILQNGETAPVKAKILAVMPLYPKFKYGDRLELLGLLSRPENFADPSGKIFDYQGYLAKEGIYYELERPVGKLVASDKGNFLKAGLFKIKRAFLDNIGALIPEPHASLLGGLVVGAKHSLGKNLLDDFRRAGVIHIVVLSGYNITIVAEAVIKFFGFLPRYLGQSLGALSIILFAIMTGGSATIVRASVMALLVILARVTGRRYAITRALILAGFLMVLENPKILVFDSSFQLSFMSTLALIYVSPVLEKYFTFVTERLGLRSVVVATLSTQIFVLPMLLYKMGELSLVALPVNLLILLIIPATMFFGFMAGLAGFVSLISAFPFAVAAYALLQYQLQVVEFFSHLRFASLAVGNFPLWLAVLCYVFYMAIFLRLRPKNGANFAGPEKVFVDAVPI
jgi:competence protein ComEC